jgi:hypothetical protein
MKVIRKGLGIWSGRSIGVPLGNPDREPVSPWGSPAPNMDTHKKTQPKILLINNNIDQPYPAINLFPWLMLQALIRLWLPDLIRENRFSLDTAGHVLTMILSKCR